MPSWVMLQHNLLLTDWYPDVPVRSKCTNPMRFYKQIECVDVLYIDIEIVTLKLNKDD